MSARALTLVELMVVVVLIGVLAAVVAPGLGSVRATQRDAGLGEIRRLLRITQQEARTTGRPAGIRFDAEADHIQRVQLHDGSGVLAAIDSLGQPHITQDLATFGGLDLVSIDPGTGNVTADSTIWFNFMGRPELRDNDGDNPAIPTTSPQLQFASGVTISLDQLTGWAP